ncbi:snRNA-activating protein complex subunit 5 [Tupaia chinensis]|uniref:snRNA-activating protein complex subunit 5 n=2 Tax=Tupaia chinensis TaxID=246437 RepID=L9KIS0_TUPCH|nr:snRNA-activating protein complex subunit 5 [Tupaia chinensis]
MAVRPAPPSPAWFPGIGVEELALQSMIRTRRGDEVLPSQPAPQQAQDMLMNVDNEASINQTALELGTRSCVMEEEEEEESDS